MRYGLPLSAGYGDIENNVAYVIVARDLTRGDPALKVTFRPAAGRGNAYFQIYRNSELCAVVYATEGAETPAVSIPLTAATFTQICVLRVGQLSDARADYSRVARTFEASTAKYVTLRWTWAPELVGALDDGGYTSSWTVNGMTYTRGAPVAMKSTWTQLTFDLLVSGGTLTINAYNGNVLVMTGTATVASLPAAVTLNEVDGSGLSGTVTVSASVAETEGAQLLFRWPASKQILRNVTDPPSTVVAIVPFNNADAQTWTEPSALAAATYYYRTRDISDTGSTGTASSSQTFVVNGPPAPPTNLHYDSGNNSNTIVHFTGSTTSGASYNFWVAKAGDAMNMSQPTGTIAPGGTGTTLPVLSYPDSHKVLIRAVKDGIEENNCELLALEYDAAGDYVPPRPNTPSINELTIAVTAGRTLAVRGLYDALNEKGVATHLKLFSRTLGGSYNFASPDETVALTLFRTNLYYADFSHAYGSNELRYICIKAATAGGVLGDASGEVLVDLNDAALAAPVNVEGWVSRG